MYVWFIGLNHSKYRVLFRVVYSGITTFESKEASPTIIRRIEHYVMENPTTVFYMCTAASEACRDYEKDLKKLVEKDELQSTII